MQRGHIDLQRYSRKRGNKSDISLASLINGDVSHLDSSFFQNPLSTIIMIPSSDPNYSTTWFHSHTVTVAGFLHLSSVGKSHQKDTRFQQLSRTPPSFTQVQEERVIHLFNRGIPPQDSDDNVARTLSRLLSRTIIMYIEKRRPLAWKAHIGAMHSHGRNSL